MLAWWHVGMVTWWHGVLVAWRWWHGMVVMSVGGLMFCDQHNGHKWFLLPFIANFKGTPSPKTQIAFKKKAPNQIFSFYQNQKNTPAYF